MCNVMKMGLMKRLKTFMAFVLTLSLLMASGCPSLETSVSENSSSVSETSLEESGNGSEMPEESESTFASDAVNSALPTNKTDGFVEPSETSQSEESSETSETTASSESSENTEITKSTETEETTEPTNLIPEDTLSETARETASSETTESSVESQEVAEEVIQQFEVHFIDVGQGDASLIICDGEAMLIDGGPSDKSDLIYSYLQKCEVSQLKYIVGTHPDDDHIGGLSGALNYATVERAFCSVDEYDSRPFSSFQKYLNKQRVVLEIPEAGTELELGSAKVQILGPRVKLEDTNNNSIVIRIVYGQYSFLFTGDAEFDEENSLLNSSYDLSSTVLKVAHHGSEYSTSDRFLKKVNPEYAIISCGRDNAYGFPKQSILDKLKDQSVDLLRTDIYGDIVFVVEHDECKIYVEKDVSDDVFIAPGTIETVPDSANTCDYIVNTNTGKFHYPGCSAVSKMKEKNKWYYTGTREELIGWGYVPCKICKP